MKQLASALCALHSRDIIHRDIKPANVFLASDGTAKLGDFGLSRPLSDDDAIHTGRQNLATTTCGTPYYLSPERYVVRSSHRTVLVTEPMVAPTSRACHLSPLSHRYRNQDGYSKPVDLWSLGCVLYELITLSKVSSLLRAAAQPLCRDTCFCLSVPMPRCSRCAVLSCCIIRRVGCPYRIRRLQ